jgi:hypothetical protein
MLPRKYVTATTVTIASSDQAGARISPEGAQPLQPKAATHEPPPSMSKHADHQPLPNPALHHQAKNPHAAQSRHRDNPAAARSVAPKPSPPPVQTAVLTADSSRPHRPGATAARRPTSSPKHAQGRQRRAAAARRAAREAHRPARPEKPPPPRLHAADAPSPISSPAPTDAAQAAATPSAAAAYLGPPPPDVESSPRRRGQRSPPPFGDEARRHRGKGDLARGRMSQHMDTYASDGGMYA